MMDRMPVEAPSSERELITGDLDDEQREAVLAARGPVCVLAGAGTGKTRTITRRIANLVAAGHVQRVLAVTFTQRAAGECGRLRASTLLPGMSASSVQAMTFHAAARRQLSYFWPRVVGDTGWQLLDTKFAVVARAANRAGLSASTDDVRDLAGEIEWARRSQPQGYAATVAQASRDIPFDAARRNRTPDMRPSRLAVTAWRCSTSTTCCCTRGAIETTMQSPGNSATATAALSSTNTRTSPAAAAGARPGSVARRPHGRR
jgi:DNA helicase-2/ATP-dependent DNA helicase PcrA